MDAEDLDALGWDDRWAALFAAADPGSAEPGRILRHDGASVLVGTSGRTVAARVRPATGPLAVGDWVLLVGGAVHSSLPRHSLLQRRDPSTGDAQPIAANVDVVGIVCGLDRGVNVGRIERFTALAWDAGATPLAVLTKADLVDDVDTPADAVRDGVPWTDVTVVSARTGRGIDDLLRRCAGSTLALVGESGSGKSTLLNALAKRDVSATAPVREGDHKGRHTTTARELHVLDGEVRLIDTPGVREVGLHTDVDTVDSGFVDIAEAAVGCRFRDYSHDREPGCAVHAAVEEGRLPLERMESWRSLRREAASAELRADPAARQDASRRQGRVYREAQQFKRRNR